MLADNVCHDRREILDEILSQPKPLRIIMGSTLA